MYKTPSEHQISIFDFNQSCGGKTPFELLQFMFPDLYEKMIHYGLTPIEKDKVILKPYLLK